MYKSNTTFDDLVGDVTLKIFENLPLKQRIGCFRVSKEWSSTLARLAVTQQTLVIGEREFDSEFHMRLSVCHVHPHHVETSFNTLDIDSLSRVTVGVLRRLLRSFKNLKSIFINAPVKMRLSDLPKTIEHIHFGHDVEDVITFDNTDFPNLTCISAENNLLNPYANELSELIEANKLRLENLSLFDVWGSLIDQMDDMPNLKQLVVFNSAHLLDDVYAYTEDNEQSERTLLGIHPKMQYFSVCLYNWGMRPNHWVMEMGSSLKPLTRDLVNDIYESETFEKVVELNKDTIIGLHFNYEEDNDYEVHLESLIILNTLKNVRITFTTLSNESIILGLKQFWRIGPNLQNIQVRFMRKEVFKDEPLLQEILNEVYSFAQKNPKRSIQFALGAIEDEPYVPKTFPKNVPKNLAVSLFVKKYYK